jgi:hypothetical protein
MGRNHQHPGPVRWFVSVERDIYILLASQQRRGFCITAAALPPFDCIKRALLRRRFTPPDASICMHLVVLQAIIPAVCWEKIRARGETAKPCNLLKLTALVTRRVPTTKQRWGRNAEATERGWAVDNGDVAPRCFLQRFYRWLHRT